MPIPHPPPLDDILLNDTTSPPDGAAALAAVDGALSAEIDALADEWNGLTSGLGVDILPRDLPRWLEDLLVGRGKRLRTTLAYWGFRVAGGLDGTPPYQDLIRAAAALETLHLFALIHDDVMDESDSRRGRPSAHREAQAWHRQAGGHGDGELFGRNLAILLGDLAHTLADRLADRLSPPLRRVWYPLSIELIAGQRADLTGAAAGRRDRHHAARVADLKSGRYTVQRPLQLGALAALAGPELTAALATCGRHLGYAFALRDDSLGIWGDPEVTGKPAGDDLAEGKPTVLLSLAADRLTGADAALLRRVATPGLTREEAPALAEAMLAAGIAEEVERIIAAEFEAAMACLANHDLPSDAVAGLRLAAHRAAWRAA